ncbi:hypothetical protein BD769DRAFT_1393713 [Suillus cothurnatus]|nr:hypothetical protein BD769DRAFT_1393713 [Suillus cothurnatus]
MPDQSDQCAIGPDSHLKDAYEIVWHNNLDDEHPILAPGPSATAEKSMLELPDLQQKLLILTMLPHQVQPGANERLVMVQGPASELHTSDDAGHDTDAIEADSEDDPDCTEGDVEASYAQTKAMGDADHDAGKTHLKSECTTDVRTIFCKKDDLSESGHVCTICENPDHLAVYQAHCKNLQIPMHAQACPKSDETLQCQGSLDGIVVHQPWAPVFTTSSLLDYIVELVVYEDKDIPHQKALCEEIVKKAKATEVRVKEILKDIPGKVSFMFDAWTSGDPFLSVTSHYIHVPPERPNAWKLQTDVTNTLALGGYKRLQPPSP